MLADLSWAGGLQIFSAFVSMIAVYFTWLSAAAARRAAEAAAEGIETARGIAAAERKQEFNQSWQSFNELAMRNENLDLVGTIWFPGQKKEDVKRQYLFFMVLNNIHNAYSANIHGIISDDFWKSTAEDQARMMLPYRTEVENLLEQFGYEPEFAQAFKTFFEQVSTESPKLPSKGSVMTASSITSRNDIGIVCGA